MTPSQATMKGASGISQHHATRRHLPVAERAKNSGVAMAGRHPNAQPIIDGRLFVTDSAMMRYRAALSALITRLRSFGGT